MADSPATADLTPGFVDLLEQTAIAGALGQHRLAVLVGEADWQFDPLVPVLGFDNGVQFTDVQIIGSEADSGTFRWAWSSPDAGTLPDAVLRIARELKELGERDGVPELTAESLPAELLPGAVAAMVATAAGGADAWYRCPHGAGAVFVSIRDDRLIPAHPDVLDLVDAITNVISAVPINHRRAILSWLDGTDTIYRAEEREVIVGLGQNEVRLAFDAADRVTTTSTRAGREATRTYHPMTDSDTGWRKVGRFLRGSQVAWTFIASFGLMAALGWFIDGQAGTAPWGVIAGCATGFAIGGWLAWRDISRSDPDDDDDDA